MKISRPYEYDASDIVSTLRTDDKVGLSQQEVKERRKTYGENTLPSTPPPSYLSIFISQFKSPLIYILLIAAAIIFFVESKTDALFISFVLLLNAFVGTYQEGKSGNILQSLKKLITVKTTVVRDGVEKIIDARQLVPGDIIICAAGDQIPADARIITEQSVRVNEAVLTGESTLVNKTADVLSTPGEVPVHDQVNMLFSGTFVHGGYARAVVVAIGRDTAVGRLHKMFEGIDATQIPLQKEIERVAYFVLILVLGICAFLFVIGMMGGYSMRMLLTMLTALFICVVPEGLPVIFTLVLAIGVWRMAKQNVLVKRLQAIEGLGHVDVIAVDKTGTLTKDQMSVAAVVVDHEQLDPHHARDAAIWPALFTLVREKGDQTDRAFLTFAQEHNVNARTLSQQLSRCDVSPFDYHDKVKIGFFQGDMLRAYIPNYNGEVLVGVFGSPEQILSRCQNAVAYGSLVQNLLDSGMRVIAFGYALMDEEEWKKQCHDICFDTLPPLIFYGLYGLHDVIREGVDEVVAHAREYGIHIAMVTGDHKKTAFIIARASGIAHTQDDVVEGKDLDLSSDVSTVPVFARVTPQQKVDIIQNMQQHGHVVAMTGDGVNDAPSLAAANVGIAMGEGGTEVAREAADIVLLKDTFGTVVHAVEEGRSIFYALRRVVLYFFSTNVAEILIILFAISAHLPLPLRAIQILWLNLITDGFLDMALAMSPHHEKYDLHRVSTNKKIIDGTLIARVFFMAVPMACGSLFAFSRCRGGEVAYAQTVALITMALFQLANVWNCRFDRASIFHHRIRDNVLLAGVSIAVLLLQVAIVYIPFLQKLFHTMALSLYDWIFMTILASTIIIFEELRKWYVRV